MPIVGGLSEYTCAIKVHRRPKTSPTNVSWNLTINSRIAVSEGAQKKANTHLCHAQTQTS